MTPNHLRVLGISSAAGRLIVPDEERLGSTGAVINHRLWTTRSDARRDLTGETVRINGQPVTIPGVAERDFLGADARGRGPYSKLPKTTHARIASLLQGDVLRNRGVKKSQVIGRLKPGHTTETQIRIASVGASPCPATGCSRSYASEPPGTR